MKQEKTQRLSLIVGLFGRYEVLTNAFHALVEACKGLASRDVEFIFVTDDAQWVAAPLYQMLPLFFPGAKTICFEEPGSLPAKVFNAGLNVASGDYITFLYPTAPNPIKKVKAFFDAALEKNADAYCAPRLFDAACSYGPTNRYGLLQYKCEYLPNDIFVKADALRAINGFNPSPLLQTLFMQEMMLRLSLCAEIEDIPYQEEECFDFAAYPFLRRYHFKADLMRRYALRNARAAFGAEDVTACNEKFLLDLPTCDIAGLAPVMGARAVSPRDANSLKITVLGGYWEYHHNQLCFFNYFERAAGSGFCTYKSCFDATADFRDIRDSNLVIFSRCRSGNAVSLLRQCKEHGIPTIYMIDDNWISIAGDYPEYGAIFVKGKPDYDNFIEAIGLATTTLLYNDCLREDLAPYARHITRFTINIEDRMFTPEHAREKGGELLIGFSGSLRYDDDAFVALERVARKVPGVRVLLSGVLSPSQRALFEGLDYIELPFSSYASYARNMANLRPDLLIAPLTDSRTSRSKCFNKYLESGVVKAAGLFSNIPPYTDVVTDGVNGFLVKENTTDGWTQALERIVRDREALARVQDNAYRDIMDHYSTSTLLPSFEAMIRDIAEKGVSA